MEAAVKAEGTEVAVDPVEVLVATEEEAVVTWAAMAADLHSSREE